MSKYINSIYRVQELIKKGLKDGLTAKQIAKKYTISSRTVFRHKAKLAKVGWSPEHDMTHEVPEGFQVKGVSTLYDSATGKAKIQWVKSSIDADRQLEMMRETVAAMCDDIPRIKDTIKNPNSLINLY